MVAEDLTAAGIARYAGIHLAQAEWALTEARNNGVINDDGAVDPLERLALIAELPKERVADIHAAVARRLFAAGPDRLVDALNHARAAGTLMTVEEIVAMADQGGRLSLSVSDYAAARQLFELAVELDASDDLATQGHRLCALADACRGVGSETEARRLLVQAAQLGELARNPSLVATAAVAYSTPCDWNDGDPQASGLLHRAESMDLAHDDRVAVQAARASVEMRIPLLDDQTHQVAWVTRPGVAQPLADAALHAAASCSDEVRLLALLSWRSTHRGPTFLDQRRVVSAEAVDLAQRLRRPRRLVEAAAWMAVDAIESGDRPRLDESLAIARWVAARDGSPAIEWRSLTLACGTAHLDGELDRAIEFAAQARAVGERCDVPGWFGFDLVMATQVIDDRDIADEMLPFLIDDDSYPVMANPFAQALTARFFARNSRPERAERSVRRAYRQLEEESAYLLLCSRLAMVAGPLGLKDLCQDLIGRLNPWSDRVAVDSHGWFTGGPVAIALATLHHAQGDDVAAQRFLDLGEPIARAINDVRSLRRIELLRPALKVEQTTAQSWVSLTPRELEVLTMLARGSTNPEIARELAYSLSTIRTDTVSIYKKLGVKGRIEAVSRASALHLL